MKRARLAVDGASRGNPGPSGIGVVIYDARGRVAKEIGEHIGHSTNNVAEYSALIRGLREALDMGFTHIAVQTDSELVARQINGQYRVKNPGISPLFNSALDLLRRFEAASVIHVTRDKNTRADALASKASTPDAKPVQLQLLADESGDANIARGREGQEKP